jgi:predicted nucleic acid-binding protein
MPTFIISDTTCLVILEKIGKLEILQLLYKEVLITTEISKEFRKKLPNWIKIQDPTNADVYRNFSEIVDAGEASAITLSIEIGDCILILDDLKARKLAHELNLRYTGTIGILLLAKNKGLIDKMDEIIDKIHDSDFRLSKSLIDRLKSGN